MAQTRASRPHFPEQTLPGENGASDRWTPNRKDELIRRIRAGAMTVAQACNAYGLSVEEIDSWDQRRRQFGSRGLAIHRLQTLRPGDARG